jgi:hypothetical protein
LLAEYLDLSQKQKTGFMRHGWLRILFNIIILIKLAIEQQGSDLLERSRLLLGEAELIIKEQ